MVRVDSIRMAERTVVIGGGRLVAIMEDADSMGPLEVFRQDHHLLHLHRQASTRDSGVGSGVGMMQA